MSQERIKELEEKILYHKKAYYTGKQEITDDQYDAMENELRQLDPNNKVLNKVGYELNQDGKIIHKKKMLSLDKTKSVDGIVKLLEYGHLLLSDKMDGSSGSIHFKNGEFDYGCSRGNGQAGENWSEHLVYVDFPKEIDFKEDIEIRGEVVIRRDNFIKLCKHMKKLGLEEPKSIRNCVAGLLNRKSNINLCVYLDFIAFDVIYYDIKLSYIETFNFLHSLDFMRPDHIIAKNKNDIERYISGYKENKDTDNYLKDGIVGRIIDNKICENLGYTERSPKFSIAWKDESETTSTKIKDIEYNIGKTGKLTMVAIVEPVELSGATIERVTLHNPKLMIDNNISINSTIEITRSNEIIPKFLSLIEAGNKLNIPELCPSCNTKLEWSNTNTDLICENDHCDGKIFQRILHFGRTLNIEGLGDSNVRKLMDYGYVETIDDIFSFNANALLNIDGFKKKSAEKLYNAIQSKKEIPFSTFLASLSIDGLGKSVSKWIEDKYETYINFMCADKDSLLEIVGIGETIVNNILNEKLWIESIKHLLETNGCTIVDKQTKPKVEGVFSGKKFIISDATTMGKKDIYKMIEAKGGEKVTTVKKSDILICNVTTTGKYKDAIKFEKEVWTEDKFMNKAGVL